MKQRWLQIVSGLVVALAAMNWLSCGRAHRLVSIEIQPVAGFTFLNPDPASQVVFTAVGTYIHPPETKDITSKVTWKTDIPQLLTVNGNVVSPIGGCGIADVYASMNNNGDFISNSAPVTVDDPTRKECPGGSTAQGVVTVSILPSGGGTVTSVPPGITCPGTCGAQFTVGNPVALLATPNTGHTFSAWSGGCTSTTATCSLTLPTGTTNAIATFN